jgi:NAD(P)H-quinone oxidoreductase subunit 5
MIQYFTCSLFFDSASLIMLFLILFIGISIGSFAQRYLKGDSRRGFFFFYLSLLIVSLGVVATTDNIFILLASWCISNLILVRLMIHKANWQAAFQSGLLAAKNYLIGGFLIGMAFLLLYFESGEVSIQKIIYQNAKAPSSIIPLLLLLVGAMTQSAILPFHRWLISSLNSPTPVSAIMHAGLVNGGGFLLIRFAPLFLNQPYLLSIILLIGIITAVTGTCWKLMQSDVKRMLACSTMGQMGFMFVQCGLGLFPAAMAHLVMHGMFKAYLFLASSSAAQEKRFDLNFTLKPKVLTQVLLCGLVGSYSFSLVSDKSWMSGDSTLVLMVIVFLTACQTSIPIFSLKARFKLLSALILTSSLSVFYGLSVSVIEMFMEPMHLMQPQPLNGLHFVTIFILLISWSSVLFFDKIKKITSFQHRLRKAYVLNLNASQPDSKTTTPYRNNYKY